KILWINVPRQRGGKEGPLPDSELLPLFITAHSALSSVFSVLDLSWWRRFKRRRNEGFSSSSSWPALLPASVFSVSSCSIVQIFGIVVSDRKSSMLLRSASSGLSRDISSP